MIATTITAPTSTRKFNPRVTRGVTNVAFEMAFVRAYRGFERETAAMVAKYRVVTK